MKILLYSEKTCKQYILIPICNNFVLIRKGFVSYDHVHPVYHLVFVLKGMGQLFSTCANYPLREKDIFIINPNEKHVYKSDYDGGMTHFTTNFYLLTLENYKILEAKGVWDNGFDKEEVEALAESERLENIFELNVNDVFFEYEKILWSDIIHHIDTFCGVVDKTLKSNLTLVSMEVNQNPLAFYDHYTKFVADIFYSLLNPNIGSRDSFHPNEDILLGKILHYLNDTLYDEFRLSELAASINYSPVYLCSYFKNKTGITITQYLNKLKLSKASELLRGSEKTITEIASVLNYSSPNHFSNNFKKEKGISPKDYRKYSEV